MIEKVQHPVVLCNGTSDIPLLWHLQVVPLFCLYFFGFLLDQIYEDITLCACAKIASYAGQSDQRETIRGHSYPSRFNKVMTDDKNRQNKISVDSAGFFEPAWLS